MPAPVAKNPHNSETLGDEVAELLEEIEALRANYEQYFLGIERKPPTARHDRLKKRVVAIQTTTVRQTAAKFKAQSLNNKLLTYERLWSRTLKEIEDGTYKRDLFKAKLHRHDREEKDPVPPPPPPDALKQAGSHVRADALHGPSASLQAGKAGTPAAAKAPVQAAPVAAPSGQISEQKMRAIYDAYLTAKKRCNEDTSKLSYDSVASTLRQQVPALMKQHNAKSVEFKVVIKDGKAVLRALPKE